MAQCEAKSKQSGERCKRKAGTGTVCKIHGGASPVGIASPQFKTGRYSAHLPARLQDRYQASLTDTELLNNREEISLVDSRISDLLARVDTGESGERWEQVKKAFQAWRKAPLTEQAKAEMELEAAILAGVSDHQAWRELGEQIDRRAALAEKEKKRLLDLQQYVTVDKLMGAVALLVDVVKRHVSDRNALAAIAADIRAVLHAGPAGGGAES